MSPPNWLCRSEHNPALNTHGDNALSPQIPDTKLTVTSKVQFLQLQHVFRQKCKKHNPSHVQRHTLPSQLLITQFRLNTHNLSRVLQHQKQTQYSMLQIKTLFIKYLSTFAILLLLHHPSFYFLTTISAGPYKIISLKRVSSSCTLFAEGKPRFYRPDVLPLIKAIISFERLKVDFKGPQPFYSYNRFLFTVIDKYSHFPFAFACSDTSSQTVIKYLTQLFAIFNIPMYVHSDRGPSFISTEIKTLLPRHGISLSCATS